MTESNFAYDEQLNLLKIVKVGKNFLRCMKPLFRNVLRCMKPLFEEAYILRKLVVRFLLFNEIINAGVNGLHFILCLKTLIFCGN